MRPTIAAMDKEPSFKGKTGLARIWRALFYSLDGLKAAMRHEAAFRQELLLTLVGIPLALWLEPGMSSPALVISALFRVLIVQLLNSAIEAAGDRGSLEKSPLAKRAKDIGSAAVLLSLINVVVVWGIVLSS